MKISNSTSTLKPIADNTDIVLVFPPPFLTRTVPLGLGYLSEYLRSNGFQPAVVDLNVALFKKGSTDDRRWWEISALSDYSAAYVGEQVVQCFSREIESFIAGILASPVKLIGFSTTAASVTVATYLAHRIKTADQSKVIIFGGPGVYTNYGDIEATSKRLIDIFVVGEGEKPLLDIMRRFAKTGKKEDLLGVKGTSMWFNGQYHDCLPQDHIREIDTIPAPTFDDFDLDLYRMDEGHICMPILTSRGCVNRCSYCIDCHMNFPYRFRSPGSVLEDIEYHVTVNNIREFQFNDLLCNGNLQQLEKICDLIIERKLDIRWSSYAIIRTGMTETLCRKIKDAGCVHLCYGVESGSDIVLKKMNKRYTVALVEEVLHNTYAAGIKTALNIIIGFPGETAKAFRETWGFVKRNAHCIDEITNISTYFYMHGSDIAKDNRKYGLKIPFNGQNILRFLQKRPGEMVYRAYRAVHNNTPRVRARRLRKLVSLVYRLGIETVIINRAGDIDTTFDAFLEKLQAQYARQKICHLENKNMAVVLNRYKKAGSIVYSSRDRSRKQPRVLVTDHLGFNSCIFYKGAWFDSSCGDWKVALYGTSLHVSIRWRQVPVIQEWRIACKRNTVQWDVKTWCNEPEYLETVKSGLHISPRYTQYTINKHCHVFPAKAQNEWQEEVYERVRGIVLCGDPKGKDMPRMEMKVSSNYTIGVQAQTPPVDIAAQMVYAYTHFNDEETKKQLRDHSHICAVQLMFSTR